MAEQSQSGSHVRLAAADPDLRRLFNDCHKVGRISTGWHVMAADRRTVIISHMLTGMWLMDWIADKTGMGISTPIFTNLYQRPSKQVFVVFCLCSKGWIASSFHGFPLSRFRSRPVSPLPVLEPARSTTNQGPQSEAQPRAPVFLHIYDAWPSAAVGWLFGWG